MNDQDLRIGDADRDRAAADLGEHYAQGRLTTDEHLERLDRIWAAKTRRELGPVFADLPGHRFASPPPGPATSRRHTGRRALWRRVPPPFLVLLLVLAAVAVVAHLPLVLIGLGAWFLFSRGGCGGRMHRRW